MACWAGLLGWGWMEDVRMSEAAKLTSCLPGYCALAIKEGAEQSGRCAAPALGREVESSSQPPQPPPLLR